MTTSVERLATDPGRDWTPRPGASDDQIAQLLAVAPWPVPDALLALLRYANGGAGELALAPCWFVLDPVELIVDSFHDPELVEQFAGFCFFGGNGGLERIALDCRSGPPFPVVMIDPIAGPDSAEAIAPDVDAFIAAIGYPYPES